MDKVVEEGDLVAGLGRVVRSALLSGGPEDPIEHLETKTKTKGPECYEEVDHPAHYGGADSPYEAKKIIRSTGLGFSTGNVLKYVLRAGKKPGQSKLKDLKKALWYLEDEIRYLESGEL